MVNNGQPVCKRVYRHLTDNDRMQILKLRYGSLTQFDEVKMRLCDLSRALRLHPCTILHFLRNFDQRGRDLSKFKFKSTRFSFMSERLKRFLCEKHILQEWAPYSIKERCFFIQRVFNESVSKTTL